MASILVSIQQLRRYQSVLAGNVWFQLSDSELTTITDKVIPAMRVWQNLPLKSLYTLVWLDGIYYKVRHDGRVVSRVLYSVLGLSLSGRKQVLGIYTAESESAKFWLSVLTDLK